MLKLWSKICLGIFAVLFVVSESFAITGSGGANVTVTPDWITVMGNKHKTVVNFTAQYTTNTVTCSAGTYFNGTTCSTTCPQKYYCPGGTFTLNGGIQGRDACPASHPNSAQGNTSINKCYKSCESKTGHTLTSGSAVYYDNTNTCTYTPNNYSIDLTQDPGSGGTMRLYTTYGKGVYLDSARTQAMSTTANKITVPTGGPVVKVYFDPRGGKCNGTSETSYNMGNQAFAGYSTYIGPDGFITQAGLTAAMGIYGNGARWTASWGKATVSVPKDCERTGYTFAGWYSQANGQGTSYATGDILTQQEMTVYAHWTAKTYTCPAGKYLDGTTCTACGEGGYYCPGGTLTYNGGIVGRHECPANSYCPAGSSAPTACSTVKTVEKREEVSCNITNGTGIALENRICYRSTSSAKSDAATDCTGSTNCEPWRQIQCKVSACNTGYYVNDDNTACTPKMYKCYAGQYLETGATSCSPCVAGNLCTGGEFPYSTTGPQGMTSCGGGKWSGASASSCIDIDAGCYGSSAKSSCPAECTAGTYAPKGSSSCTTCPANSYCPAKSGSPTACSTVQFSEQGTQSCTITHGTGKQGWSRQCRRRESSAGSKSRDDCTGSQNCGGYTYNTCYVDSCETGYSKNSSNTACEPNPYKITYNCVDGYYGTSTKPTHEVTATFGMSYTIPLDAYCTHSSKPFGGWNFPSE